MIQRDYKNGNSETYGNLCISCHGHKNMPNRNMAIKPIFLKYMFIFMIENRIKKQGKSG